MAERLTQVWPVDPLHPGPAVIQAAARILVAGGLVAFPTETVYGLGANALDPEAVRRIYVAKGRPSHNPIIIHVSDTDGAKALVSSWPESARLLAERFWPGPLTLVLPRSTLVPDIIAGGGPTVAVRCPTHPVALALIREAGVPIAAPSANRSSELSPTLPEHVLHGLAGRIDVLLDGGPTLAGIESTVIDLSRAVPRLLRPGPIPPGELEALLGPLERTVVSGEGPLPSPGLLARHYAPYTTLECWLSLEMIERRAKEIGDPVGIVAREDAVPAAENATTILLPVRADRYAAEMYRVLHELDRLGLARILVLLPPETDEWLAVRDRLLRAAAK